MKQRNGILPQLQGAMPVAPIVYRPQAVPRVLQRKTFSGQPPHAGQPLRQPVAPPVYRPAAKKIVQPKVAATTHAPKLPVAPPVYRPQPTPKVLQTKDAFVKSPQVGVKSPQVGALSRQPISPPVYRPHSPPGVLTKKDFQPVVSVHGHQHRTMPHHRLTPARELSNVALPQMGKARSSFAPGIAAAGAHLIQADGGRMGARAGSSLGPVQAKMGNSKQTLAGVKKGSSPFLHTSNRSSYPYSPMPRIQHCCAVIQRMIVPLGDLASLAQHASFDERFEANTISKATESLRQTGLHGHVRRLHAGGVGAVLNGLGDNEELVLVAHGGHDFNEKVIHVYGGLTPTALAKTLVDNGLGENYAGEIYLNGCNSATEIGPSKSYAKLFQEALAARGRRVRVKGNRGASKVLDNGVTVVVGPTNEAREASARLGKITNRVKQIGKNIELAKAVSTKLLNGQLSEDLIEEFGRKDLGQQNPTAETVLQELGQKLIAWKDELNNLLPEAEELSRQAFVTDNSQVTSLARPSEPYQTAHQILNLLLVVMVVVLAIGIHRKYFSNS